jgi:hypothetical protein
MPSSRECGAGLPDADLACREYPFQDGRLANGRGKRASRSGLLRLASQPPDDDSHQNSQQNKRKTSSVPALYVMIPI